MIDRQKYFPLNFFMIILILVSGIINFYLYYELKNEQDKKYWISSNEYKQIVDEIKRLENTKYDLPK